jgi:hypothetical protein
MTRPPPSDYSVVVPTVGRDGLARVLAALRDGSGPAPRELVVVDDRVAPVSPLTLPDEGDVPVRVLRSGGLGPAAARNVGWASCDSDWVAFLDDDVVPSPDWAEKLRVDLAGLGEDVGATQGRIVVPLPAHRRALDVERNTAKLADSRWITADLAYRRSVLERLGGFDERFRRAYREDTDLAFRAQDTGSRIVTGLRTTTHPTGTGAFLGSVRAQRGNLDNALMRRKHGAGWRERAGEPRGRFTRHAAGTAFGLVSLACLPARAYRAAGPAAVLWAGVTAEFALHRIGQGPRTTSEVSRMLVTSVLIPPAACAYRLRGELAFRDVEPCNHV